MRKILFGSFFLMGICFFSCFFSEDGMEEDVVLLDELIYLSSNKVRLLGRVVSTSSEINDHGFYISTDESFTNPIIKSLGPKGEPGLFLIEFDSLQQSSQYYYKAFFTTNKNVYFSETSLFTTYEGKATTLTRKKGKAGETTKILGRNITNDIKVFFGNTEAQIIKRFGDFEIWVEVPVVNDNFKQPVIAKMEHKSYVVDTFRYETGKWTQLKDFTGGRFFNVVHFKDDNSFTFGLGINPKGVPNEKFFTLDLNSFTWTEQPTDLSITPVEGAFSTQSGYFGSGASNVISVDQSLVYVLENAFYKYENGSVTHLPSTPFMSNYSYAYEIDNELYVFGGRDSYYLPKKIFFKYSAGNWTDLGQLPFTIDKSMLSTRYGDKIVFVNGDEEIWEFDSSTESFVYTGQFPINISTHGLMESIDNEMVFGLFSLSNLLYSIEYGGKDLLGKLSFPGNPKYRNVAQFTHQNSIFILRVNLVDDATNTMELWKFEPFEFIN